MLNRGAIGIDSIVYGIDYLRLMGTGSDADYLDEVLVGGREARPIVVVAPDPDWGDQAAYRQACVRRSGVGTWALHPPPIPRATRFTSRSRTS